MNVLGTILYNFIPQSIHTVTAAIANEANQAAVVMGHQS